MTSSRYRWMEEDVVDAGPAAFAVRTYLDQRAVRQQLRWLNGRTPLRVACDLGAGYGRLSPVLTEFCSSVLAFERDSRFVAQARALIPKVVFQLVERLDRLPIADLALDFLLSFTVLQHLNDFDASSTCREIVRAVSRRGFVLLCEETDEGYLYGDPADPRSRFTVARPVARYAEWLRPFRLVRTSRRLMEPTYPRCNTGHYMLFEAS